VGGVKERVDAGIRAYVEGRVEEARGLLQKVLQEDPSNSRARSYMILLDGGLGPGVGRAATPAPTAPAPTQTPAPVMPAPELPVPEMSPAHTPPPGGYAPSPWDDGPASTMAVNIGAEGGLDLDAVAEKSDLRSLVPEVSRPSSGPSSDDAHVWMLAAKDLHALGDFTGSLEMIEKILRVAPDHAEAREYLHQNEATLAAMYESKLGPLGHVPRLAIKPEEVMWLNLDHRAGFLLSQIDGTVDYESLFALSGLPRLDTARILATLISDGVITS
jgi:tetratricopeptide (TPR) repeat protein